MLLTKKSLIGAEVRFEASRRTRNAAKHNIRVNNFTILALLSGIETQAVQLVYKTLTNLIQQSKES